MGMNAHELALAIVSALLAVLAAVATHPHVPSP